MTINNFIQENLIYLIISDLPIHVEPDNFSLDGGAQQIFSHGKFWTQTPVHIKFG